MARRSDIIGVSDATGSIFAHSSVPVTDVATPIPNGNMGNRKAITIFNYSNTNRVFIGGAGVTVANGYPLLPYQGLPFDLSSAAQIYGICETGKTADVRTLEIDNS